MDWSIPWRSCGTFSGSKPLAPVPHVQHDGVGLDLGVERDLGGAGPFGGVDRGFSSRIEEGAEAYR